MDKDEIEKHDRLTNQSRVNALKSVDKLDLPKVVVISDDSFSGLGLKTTRLACDELELLREEHGDNLPYLIGQSLRESWHALFKGSCYIAVMVAEGVMGDNKYTRKQTTTKGYGERMGIAWTLHGHLSNLEASQQQATIRDGTPFEERLSTRDILKGAAMYWFAEAATSSRAGDVEGAFDWLFEAQDALSLTRGDLMWEEGEKDGREGATENLESAEAAVRTTFAKAAAQVRHTENRAMKFDTFAWLEGNMTSYKSMDAAAEAITSQQPISFRTARDWVGQWKKLRSTGTA